jgi:MFS family permease
MLPLHQVQSYSLPRSLLWSGVAALASVYGAFTLSWMIYRVHLPAQMAQLGFSAQAAPLLLLVEALLTIAIEPIAGAFSDRLSRQQGTQFSLIAGSMVLASLLLVAIPLLASLPSVTGQWIVGLLLLWSIAMSGFRSPAVALLKRYSLAVDLPRAASLLTFAFGLAGAATPLASQFVLGLGAPVALTLAAVFIILSAIWLQRSNWVTRVSPEKKSLSVESIALISGVRVFSLGLLSTLALRLAVEALPKLLKVQIPGINPPLFVGLMFISLAIAALPIGKFAVRYGNSRAMVLGTAVTALLLILIPLSKTVMIAAAISVGLGVGFSLILNGTLPFVLEQVPSERAGLGMGIFFAGVAVGSSLMLAVLGKPAVLPLMAIALSLAALVGVGLCVKTVGRSI